MAHAMRCLLLLFLIVLVSGQSVTWECATCKNPYDVFQSGLQFVNAPDLPTCAAKANAYFQANYVSNKLSSNMTFAYSNWPGGPGTPTCTYPVQCEPQYSPCNNKVGPVEASNVGAVATLGNLKGQNLPAPAWVSGSINGCPNAVIAGGVPMPFQLFNSGSPQQCWGACNDRAGDGCFAAFYSASSGVCFAYKNSLWTVPAMVYSTYNPGSVLYVPPGVVCPKPGDSLVSLMSLSLYTNMYIVGQLPQCITCLNGFSSSRAPAVLQVSASLSSCAGAALQMWQQKGGAPYTLVYSYGTYPGVSGSNWCALDVTSCKSMASPSFCNADGSNGFITYPFQGGSVGAAMYAVGEIASQYQCVRCADFNAAESFSSQSSSGTVATRSSALACLYAAEMFREEFNSNVGGYVVSYGSWPGLSGTQNCLFPVQTCQNPQPVTCNRDGSNPVASVSTTNPGATAKFYWVQVTSCPRGQFFNTPTNLCSQCPAGQYSAGGYVNFCNACPPNTYSSPGSSVCSNCPSGSIASSDGTSCIQCPAGSSAASGATSCVQCPVGFTPSADRSTCVLCPAGSISTNGQCVVSLLAPQPCPDPFPTCRTAFGLSVGYCLNPRNLRMYSTYCMAGDSECANTAVQPALYGAALWLRGSVDSSCVSWQQLNAVACPGPSQTCLTSNGASVGYCWDPRSDRMVSTYCNPASDLGCPNAAANATNAPIAGPGGVNLWFRQPGGDSQCTSYAATPCPTTQSCNGNNNGGCSYNSAIYSTYCIPANDASCRGTPATGNLPVLVNGVPIWFRIGITPSSPCTLFATSLDLQAMVLACPNANCLQCPVGTAVSSFNDVCEPCASGSILDPNSHTCTQCPAGTYSLVGFASCQTCPAGFTSTAGSSACFACPAGSTSSNGFCSFCPAGTFAPQSGMPSCTVCPAGFTSPTNSTQCSPCDVGQTSTSGICFACPQGTFANSAGSPDCTTCPSGSTSQPATGATSCIACPVGSNSTLGICNLCPAGTFGSSQGPNGFPSCNDCIPGTIANVPGQTSCTACLANTYSVSSTQCVACPAGTSTNGMSGMNEIGFCCSGYSSVCGQAFGNLFASVAGLGGAAECPVAPTAPLVCKANYGYGILKNIYGVVTAAITMTKTCPKCA